jgi:hypothetical protein
MITRAGSLAANRLRRVYGWKALSGLGKSVAPGFSPLPGRAAPAIVGTKHAAHIGEHER